MSTYIRWPGSSGGTLIGLTLPPNNIIVGNASSTSVALDTSSVGAILADSVNGLTIKPGVIVNADINASAAIAYSKLAALTANRALISDASGFVSVSAVTNTELSYVSGVTSPIQSQLNTISSTIQNFEWQPSVLSASILTPPGSPTTGDRYLINGTGAGGWTGHDNQIAQWSGSAWIYTTGSVGMFVAADDQTDRLYLFGGVTWATKYFESTTASTGLTKVGFDIQMADATGTGITVSSGALAVQFDNSTIGLTANQLVVKTGGITNTQVSNTAAIAYSKLSLSNSIVNADINTAAAIAYSKLNLSNSIVNADINASAAIAYSKLSLSNSIVNADINSAAAIAYSKLNLAASVKASDINSQAANSGYALTADGLGAASFNPVGSVTSISATVPGFLSVSGSPITTSGTLAITYSGTALPIANGGTGLTSVPANAQFLIGNAGGTAYALHAITGDVSVDSLGASTIGTNAVTNGKFRQSGALSIVGNASNATSNVADISGATDQVLRVNSAGTVLGFGSINLASSSAVTGALTVTNGGTGQNSLTAHTVLVGNSTSAVTLVAPSATTGVALVSNGAASDPSFGAIALGSSSAVSGTLPVGNGGIGTNTLTAHTVLVGNTTSALTQVAPSATTGVALVSNGSSADPSFGAIALGSASAVSGTLGATNGGTAQSTYTTGDILYASASNTLSKLAIGSTGNVLTVAAGVPSWAAPTSSNSIATTQTTTYSVAAGIGLVLCSGSAFTVTLPAATGSGRVIKVQKTDSSFANIITVKGNGAETINGSNTTTLNTQYEEIEVLDSGSGTWALTSRTYPQTWNTYTVTIGGTGGAPTKGGGTVIDIGKWKRVGNTIEIMYNYKQTTSGSAGTGTYLFPIPSGLTINTSLTYAENDTSSLGGAAVCGHGRITIPTANLAGVANMYAYDTSNLAMYIMYATTAGSNATVGTLNATTFQLSNASLQFSFTAIVAITGWN